MTKGCPSNAEEGNVVACADQAHAPCRSIGTPGDTSFARFEDPYPSIVTLLPRRESAEVTRRLGIAVGQTHVSGKNQHRGRSRSDE